MFYVKKQEMVTKTFRLPENLLKDLELVAEKNKVSVNNLVIQCCEYALKNLVDNKEKNFDN